MSAERVPSTGGARPVRVITQAELRELRSTSETIRGLRERQAELRGEIVALHDRGAVLEPGPLRAEVRRVESRSLGYSSLSEPLGEAEASRLRDEVRPAIRMQVRVIGRDWT